MTAYAYSATAIQISWHPPPSISQNGIITSYRITIQGSPFDTDVNVLSVSVTTAVYPLLTGDSYLITHLHPYNVYTISVTAVNSAGESGSSDPINTTTLQSCKFIGNPVYFVIGYMYFSTLPPFLFCFMEQQQIDCHLLDDL